MVTKTFLLGKKKTNFLKQIISCSRKKDEMRLCVIHYANY